MILAIGKAQGDVSTKKERIITLDIVQPGHSIRPDHRLALLLGCSILAFLSSGILLIAVLETDGFKAIKVAFCSAPLVENIPRIAASAFRPRMIALGVDGLIMAFVAWLLFGKHSQVLANRESRQSGLEGTALFALCGIALMSFVTSCFLRIPILENACSLHAKEGFIDTLHPIAFATSASLLVLAAISELRSANPNRLVPIALFTIATAFFVVAMEEISWGQTFVGWRTPESVASWNYQNETNLHNAFNFVLGRAYLAAGIIGFLAISVSIALRRRMPEHPLCAILPATPMFWGALWLPLASQSGLYADTEPFESIVAILCLYYAVNIWRSSKAGYR